MRVKECFFFVYCTEPTELHDDNIFTNTYCYGKRVIFVINDNQCNNIVKNYAKKIGIWIHFKK